MADALQGWTAVTCMLHIYSKSLTECSLNFLPLYTFLGAGLTESKVIFLQAV